MNTEWQNLRTLQAVAKAHADKWEIQRYSKDAAQWLAWGGEIWYKDASYRGRSRFAQSKPLKFGDTSNGN